jgi:hypothetical protein
MGNQSRDRIAKLELLIIPQPIAEKSMREELSNLLECPEGRLLIRPSTDTESRQRFALTDDRSAINEILKTLQPTQ